MNVKEVHYERVKNLGNYESERCGVTIVVNDESAEFAFLEAQRLVNTALGIETEEEVDIFNG